MPSLIYDGAVDALAHGEIQFATDSFNVILVMGYVPDKANHATYGDVTGEVSGAGYTIGGMPVTVAVSDAGADRADIELGGANWPASTISATGAIYETGELLVCYVDFGGVISSLAGAFTLQPSLISIHNP